MTHNQVCQLHAMQYSMTAVLATTAGLVDTVKECFVATPQALLGCMQVCHPDDAHLLSHLLCIVQRHAMQHIFIPVVATTAGLVDTH